MEETTKIDFVWDFGDDEKETIDLFDSKGEPLNLSDCRLDLFIVPDTNEPIIHLSTDAGTITANERGEVEFVVSRKLTANAEWTTAKWDLKVTNALDWRDTMIGGTIKRKKYYPQERIKGWDNAEET